MIRTKRAAILCGITIVVLATLTLIFSCLFTEKAYADGTESADIYKYTLLTDENGEQSYSVAIKAAYKPSVKRVIVPNTYNGLPITEVANNGFLACAQLEKAVLPLTVKKIGNAAFMNCGKLKSIGLPAVESIGMNAFSMSTMLDRLYIPKSVKSVGANILRNNTNTVYVQSSEEQVTSLWQSTWNSYFTGEIVYNADPADTLVYREITDSQNGNIIGYELTENQNLYTIDEDITIYNSMKIKDKEELGYLPLLNICPEAFALGFANSITIKDRSTDDPSAPKFTHKINLRSGVFAEFMGNRVSIEVGVTFDHPADLQNPVYSMLYDGVVTGDSEGHSKDIFSESTVTTVTLPSDLDFITQRMFYDCSYLSDIRFIGQNYDVHNELHNISRIGDEAFCSCVSLGGITVPSTVEQMGRHVFSECGSQVIDVDMYEDMLPSGWDSEWLCAPDSELKPVVNYKQPVKVTVDWQNDEQTKTDINVKPELDFPSLEIPDRKGYEFKGIFSGANGIGKCYYAPDGVGGTPWVIGDPVTIYAYWKTIDYSITYQIDDWMGCVNPNPATYKITDVKEKALEFENDLHAGYIFTFNPSSIPQNSTGDIVVIVYCEARKFPIKYVTQQGVAHDNPEYYTYGEECVINPATRHGYNVTWDRTNIPIGTYGPITITSRCTEKPLMQSYYNGEYEIWTENQFLQLRDYANTLYTFGLYVDVDLSYTDWEAIPNFRATLYMNGHSVKYKNENVPSGSNYGFILENNGTIENGKFIVKLKGRGGSINDDVSYVAGVVAINNGSLYNIKTVSYIGKNADYMNTSGSNADIINLSPNAVVGGIVGQNNAYLSYCENNSSFAAQSFVGGIAGINMEKASLNQCDNYGTVHYNRTQDRQIQIGGIVATARDESTVTACDNYGNIIFELITTDSSNVTYIAEIAGAACNTISFTGCITSKRVIIMSRVKDYLSQSQLAGIKVNGELVGWSFAKPGSGSGGDDSCIAAGTLITLADGTLVPVESLTGNEMLLVWNLYTGSFDVAPILFIDREPTQTNRIIHLYFSDGTEVKVIYEHGFWDVSLNKYVYLNENAKDYIGHLFNKQTVGLDGNMSWTSVRLDDIKIEYEYTTAYSPVTYGHLCYYVNGLLSMPGGISGMFNVFEVNAALMKYDEAAMSEDIARYGLYTYAEFSETVNVPEAMFDAVGGKYLKVSVGKGLITFDGVRALAERYSGYFE